MWHKHILMAPADDAGAAGGAPAPAPAASPAPAATPAPAAAPDTLVNGNAPAPAATPAPAADKPADGKPAEGSKPIEYKDFTLPEGVTLDPEKIGQVKAIAAEFNMPQEKAQALIDMHLAEIKQMQEAPMKAWNDLQTKWRDEVKTDPEIGGANLDKNLATIKNGLNALLGDQAKSFYEALNITGAGNNPAIIRGLLKAAAPHAPATPVDGNPGSGGKTAGATLYPSMAGLGNGHQS